MSLPGNGIFVVQGEMAILVTAMRRGARWSSHSHQDEEHDNLLKAFQELKDILIKIDDLKVLDPNVFLSPFLDVIRSEETTGPVTNLALSAVNKFLSYGLIGEASHGVTNRNIANMFVLDPTHSSTPTTVENIADAVTRARFVGTDQASDGVVLMKILQVLRTLMLAPEGAALRNESVCEIMLSCFRICFEMRLSELLRKTAEHCLKDMVQLLFMRLPQFTEDLRVHINMKQLKMRTGAIDQTRGKRKSRNSFMYNNKLEHTQPTASENKIDPQVENILSPTDNRVTNNLRTSHLSTTPLTPAGNIVDMQGSISQSTPQNLNCDANMEATPETSLEKDPSEQESIESQPELTIKLQSPAGSEIVLEETDLKKESEEMIEETDPDSITLESESVNDLQTSEEYVNPRGVRFTAQNQEGVPLVPYGLVCVRELFRFLISLCNPLDKQNTEVMIHLGLTLLTVAFEVGADSIGKYTTLLALVKNELSRNLFSLLSTERLSIFAADLQVSFLLFESLRTHLKFQLEYYLTKLIDIIVSDSPKITYEHKEIALDNIVQLWRIPGLVTELYINYDCDMYCSNLFEELTKLLAKNAFPVTQGVYHTHLLSLDALLTIIESIEKHRSDEKSDESNTNTDKDGSDLENIDNYIGSAISARQKISEKIPTREELEEIKTKKKWLPLGTEHFNNKPKKGIQFLQEHDFLKTEFDPEEIVHFLRENPALDKKMIGDYISSRNNSNVLEAFVKMFDFVEMRIDEALRLYLETFRLPGEAPLISLIMEHFAEHWHKCNGEPFVNADAAFTLAYAVIMLNVDQHNHNVKRHKNPMTPDDFKRNLKKVNGGNEFDQDMLDEIYVAIKGEEIVMPAEHTGIVRENYLWKVLLRRGASKDGVYVHVPNGSFDDWLYSLIWGPTVAALSFVFDKSEDPAIYQRAMKGFEKCALIAAQFSDVVNFETLLSSLCKFTMLQNQPKHIYNVSIQLGSSMKSQLALKTLFLLVHQHGNILKQGWKTVLDLISILFSCQKLPKSLMEAEDFIEPSGKISLIQEAEQLQKAETGLLSSLYSYMVSSDNLSQKIPTPVEEEHIVLAQKCIKECNLEQVVQDSKFLHLESLQELIKALVECSRGPDGHKSLGLNYNENIAVFFLELLLKVVIQNRDRVNDIWQIVRDHLYTLVMGASSCDYQLLLERSVIGLLRIAIRLLRREESPTILESLRILLLLKPAILSRISRQISFGLYELLKTSAQNIHSDADWSIIFTLLECVGAGAQPPKVVTEDNQIDQGAKSEGEGPISSEEESLATDRGYTSDSELTRSPKHSSRPQSPLITVPQNNNTTGGWILVGKEGDIQPMLSHSTSTNLNQYSIVHERQLLPHDPQGLVKCCESLAFLVRDVAHITPYNFENCVHCIRTFVEASLHGNGRHRRTSARDSRTRMVSTNRRRAKVTHRSPPGSGPEEDEDSDYDDLPSGYHQVSIQLLDLMHTLHTRTAQIFRWWSEENGDIPNFTSLWEQGWCPLLQGIARLCCDNRRQIRMSAITYLQRALLVHDLQTLSGPEWEACFNKVLFPLLAKLLEPLNPNDLSGVEETRMRAATVLSKVFLHHLTPLLSLPTFTALWLTILEFMDKYMHADNSDLLFEAIPESLKNMLLVMDSAKIFDSSEGYSQLWTITWDRIGTFLPNMKQELFKEPASPIVANPVEKEKHLEHTFVSTQKPLENIVTAVQKPPENIVSIVQKPSELLQNVETATRSSIILQPPCSDGNISSPLFAHLGQMVSTPIGLPNSPEKCAQPPYTQFKQSNIISSSNSLVNQPQTYPMLYTTSQTNVIASQVTQSPISLYSEFMGNPYNNPNPYIYTSQQPVIVYQTETSDTSPELTTPYSSTVDTNTDTDNIPDLAEYSAEMSYENQQHMSNYFQSSNYFNMDPTSGNIAPGSEIFYGTDKTAPNIPLLSAPNTKS